MDWSDNFEVAPKGGSQVQLFVPGYGQYVGTWDVLNGEWTIGDRRRVFTLLPAEPTHWREPFPEPGQ